MRRWLPLIPLAVLILLGGLFAGYALRKGDSQVHPAALVGKPVPAVSLPGLDGAPAALLTARLRGQGPVMINMFASWCVPCAYEQPQLMQLKADGVRIIGVAYKDDPIKTRAFLAKLGNPFETVLVDRQGDAGVEFGVSGVPETFLVSADGVIFAKHTGPMTPDQAKDLEARFKRGR